MSRIVDMSSTMRAEYQLWDLPYVGHWPSCSLRMFICGRGQNIVKTVRTDNSFVGFCCKKERNSVITKREVGTFLASI